MTCQHCAAALIDLAASGSEPRAELRAHLQACPFCRAAFQQERNLFASIDSTLRASTNASIPPAFVQRVRAAVNQQPAAPRLLFFRPRVVFASAAAAFILFSFAHYARRAKLESGDDSIARRQPSPEAVLPKSPAPSLNSASSRVPPPIPETRRTRVSTGNLPHPSTSPPREPEILVSNDQEILLARYAEQLLRRTSLPALAAAPASEVDLSQTPALQVSPIQIAQLDVKPLAERQE